MQGKVQISQAFAPADERRDRSNIRWSFAREVFADFNRQRRDCHVACDRDEGRPARREAASVVQRLQAGGVQLDARGIVAADHGETAQAGAGHRDLLDARTLLQRQVGKARAARDQPLQHPTSVHDPPEAERLQRRHVHAPRQVERPPRQAQAAERAAAEDQALSLGVNLTHALVEFC